MAATKVALGLILDESARWCDIRSRQHTQNDPNEQGSVRSIQQGSGLRQCFIYVQRYAEVTTLRELLPEI